MCEGYFYFHFDLLFIPINVIYNLTTFIKSPIRVMLLLLDAIHVCLFVIVECLGHTACFSPGHSLCVHLNKTTLQLC